MHVRRELFRILMRYLRVLHPAARRELTAWRDRAHRVPDPTLRQQAVATLTGERANAEGAALVAALAPPEHALSVVRACVAFQVMYDYLDTITEPPVPDHRDDCALLHQAIRDALNPEMPTRDWYGLHPAHDDGGYLADLVEACRGACAGLPRHSAVACELDRSARRAGEVQTLTHCSPADRDALVRWVAPLVDAHPSLSWFEHAAGASSTLDVHTLLALAADPTLTDADVAGVRRHLVTLCALNTLLESVVDLPLDRKTGDYSYIAHYSTPDDAAGRMASIAGEAIGASPRTARRSTHVAILTTMATLYLARSEIWRAEARPVARATFAALPSGRWPLLLLHTARRCFPWA
jgi:tetraprenyl-beta-curcumene synthase